MVMLWRHRRIPLSEELEITLQHLDLHPVTLAKLLNVASGVVHA